MPLPRRRSLINTAGLSVGLGAQRFARNLAEPIERDADYIRKHGLIGTLGGSAAQVGRDLASSYKAYVEPALQMGSSVITQALLGAPEPRMGAAPTAPVAKPTPSIWGTFDVTKGGMSPLPATNLAPVPSPQVQPQPQSTQAMTTALSPTPMMQEEGAARSISPSGNFTHGNEYIPQTGQQVSLEAAETNIPTGQEAAIQMEQKKQGNIDALIVALGEMGASLMGPYQESWQAQLGKTSANLARQRVFAGAMEKALAGEVPDDAGLALLNPEQQIMISRALTEKKAMGLEERKVGITERGAATEERLGERRAVTEERRAATEEKKVSLGEKELTQEVTKWEEERTAREVEKETKAALGRLYDAEAKAAAAKLGISEEDPRHQKAMAFALDYTSKLSNELTTKEEKAAEFNKAYNAYMKKELPMVGGEPTPGAGTKIDWRLVK